MYSDEIYTFGEVIIMASLAGFLGYLTASVRYQKKIDRERAIRDRYRWQLNRQKNDR